MNTSDNSTHKSGEDSSSRQDNATNAESLSSVVSAADALPSFDASLSAAASAADPAAMMAYASMMAMGGSNAFANSNAAAMMNPLMMQKMLQQHQQTAQAAPSPPSSVPDPMAAALAQHQQQLMAQMSMMAMLGGGGGIGMASDASSSADALTAASLSSSLGLGSVTSQDQQNHALYQQQQMLLQLQQQQMMAMLLGMGGVAAGGGLFPAAVAVPQEAAAIAISAAAAAPPPHEAFTGLSTSLTYGDAPPPLSSSSAQPTDSPSSVLSSQPQATLTISASKGQPSRTAAKLAPPPASNAHANNKPAAAMRRREGGSRSPPPPNRGEGRSLSPTRRRREGEDARPRCSYCRHFSHTSDECRFRLRMLERTDDRERAVQKRSRSRSPSRNAYRRDRSPRSRSYSPLRRRRSSSSPPRRSSRSPRGGRSRSPATRRGPRAEEATLPKTGGVYRCRKPRPRGNSPRGANEDSDYMSSDDEGRLPAGVKSKRVRGSFRRFANTMLDIGSVHPLCSIKRYSTFNDRARDIRQRFDHIIRETRFAFAGREGVTAFQGSVCNVQRLASLDLMRAYGSELEARRAGPRQMAEWERDADAWMVRTLGIVLMMARDTADRARDDGEACLKATSRSVLSHFSNSITNPEAFPPHECLELQWGRIWLHASRSLDISLFPPSGRTYYVVSGVPGQRLSLNKKRDK